MPIRWTVFSLLLVLSFSTSLYAHTKIPRGIEISGNQLLRDGKPWISKGVTIVGRVSPASVAKGAYLQARSAFGAAELEAAKNVFHADTVRLQVSQPGLDPASSIYSADYKTEVAQAIQLARSMNFIVIVSMQAAGPSGLKDPSGMPSDATVRAWQTLCPVVKGYGGILLELFNEPEAYNAADQWHKGMQKVLNAVRKSGARNIVILDGLQWGRSFKGLKLPNDPLHKIVLGVHPYFKPSFTTSAEWDSFFGNAAEKTPAIATEWNATPTAGCVPNLPQTAAALMKYLKRKHMGLVGWGMDYPDTLFTDLQFQILTKFDGFTAYKEGSGIGAGEAFRDWRP
jgi:hypothetical protein